MENFDLFLIIGRIFFWSGLAAMGVTLSPLNQWNGKDAIFNAQLLRATLQAAFFLKPDRSAFSEDFVKKFDRRIPIFKLSMAMVLVGALMRIGQLMTMHARQGTLSSTLLESHNTIISFLMIAALLGSSLHVSTLKEKIPLKVPTLKLLMGAVIAFVVIAAFFPLPLGFSLNTQDTHSIAILSAFIAMAQMKYFYSEGESKNQKVYLASLSSISLIFLILGFTIKHGISNDIVYMTVELILLSTSINTIVLIYRDSYPHSEMHKST